jgi:hypothetical protein
MYMCIEDDSWAQFLMNGDRVTTTLELEEFPQNIGNEGPTMRILDLREDSCRFPMWPDYGPISFEYCGNKISAGSRYCPHHRARMRGLGTRSERWATKSIPSPSSVRRLPNESETAGPAAPRSSFRLDRPSEAAGWPCED